MGSKGFLGLLLVALTGFLSSSHAYKFFVGGKDGWVVKPSEDYDHWAERNRFQVNDTLYFRYKKGTDSVIVVKKDDYYSCNTKNPIKSLTEGDSIFVFDRSGPFFFITGNVDNCKKGQRLIVVVLAVRNKTHPSPSPSSPSPKASPPHSHHHSPSPSSSPVSPPVVQPPVGSPDSDVDQWGSDAPAPAPSDQKSGSMGLRANPFGVVFGLSVVMSVVLGSFVGQLVV